MTLDVLLAVFMALGVFVNNQLFRVGWISRFSFVFVIVLFVLFCFRSFNKGPAVR